MADRPTAPSALPLMWTQAPRHVFALPVATAFLLLLTWPAMMALATPAGEAVGPSVLFWVLLIPPVLILPWLLLRREPEEMADGARNAALQVPGDGALAADFVALVTPVVRPLRSYIERGVPVLEGIPRVPSSELFGELERRLAPRGAMPMVEAMSEGAVRIVGLPRAVEARLRSRSSYAVNILLFIATVVTTVFAGSRQQGVNLLEDPGSFPVGLPYAASLLGILGIHELGHYVMARRHGVDVTPPYFIPAPMGLGTFGAFIQIKSLIKSRRAVFDIGVAGPLAGLVVAVPVLYFGLRQMPPAPEAIASLGIPTTSSPFFALMYELANGAAPAGSIVRLSPVASAAWIGIYVTALNLVPVGQLDGGHIAYALLGQRGARLVGMFTVGIMIVLGMLVWPGLLTWALLITLLAGFSHRPALDDVTPPDGKRVALGALTLLLPIVTLLQLPLVR
jgi:membrane-associated protease RseP (regulator of RpoE activity)